MASPILAFLKEKNDFWIKNHYRLEKLIGQFRLQVGVWCCCLQEKNGEESQHRAPGFRY